MDRPSSPVVRLEKILDDVEFDGFREELVKKLLPEFKETEITGDIQSVLWLDQQPALLRKRGIESLYCLYTDLSTPFKSPHPLILRMYLSYDKVPKTCGNDNPLVTLVFQHIKFGDSEDLFEILMETRHVDVQMPTWGKLCTFYDSEVVKITECYPVLFTSTDSNISYPLPRSVGGKGPSSSPFIPRWYTS